MITKKIAIMGMGTVGGGTYRLLTQNREYIRDTRGVDIVVAKVLDRSAAALEKKGVPASLFCPAIDDIINDASIEAVVETMGGVEPAKTFIQKALESGKSVITANKELLAKARGELEESARKGGAGLYFEASCVGGVPIVRALDESFQGDRVLSLYGIINGTTNFILSKMSAESCGYASALKEAQKLGYAESDPTADVEGFDATYKLSILASLAFHSDINYTGIYREGITGITADDMKNAHDLGYEVKLLAIAKRVGEGIEARVHPVFVPKTHPLASVGGAFNAVFLNGDNVGDLMFYGAGAGAGPTGSAIVSDIIKALTSPAAPRGVKAKLVPTSDFMTGYYLCTTVRDKPGVLAQIATKLSEKGVSIKSAIQREGCDGRTTILILTHTAAESKFKAALENIKALGEVESVDSAIRVI